MSEQYPRLVIRVSYDITTRQRNYDPVCCVRSLDDFYRVKLKHPDDFSDDDGGYVVVTLH